MIARPRVEETHFVTSERALEGLEPHSFWAHFATLTTIARPSRHEEPVIEHVRAWADANGFELHQDAGRNLVIRVPATAGRESASTLVLQGHLDMVCEREPASPNDPAEGRIALLRDGDWLTADGTTLGADDAAGELVDGGGSSVALTSNTSRAGARCRLGASCGLLVSLSRIVVVGQRLRGCE